MESEDPLAGVRPLARDDLPADTAEMATWLIGRTIVHEVGGAVLAGRIVETEAYVPGDASSHAFRGRTPRNGAMFLPRGYAYVYRSYGVWWCLNVSSESEGVGAAVLIRAVQPLSGIKEMRAHRGTEKLTDLARGPGRLTVAMGISVEHNGADLCGGGPLWLGNGTGAVGQIGIGPRIGISKEVERPLRFFERGSPFVSGPKRLNAR